MFKKTPTTGSKIAKMLCKMPKNQVLFSGFLPLPNHVFLKGDFFDSFNCPLHALLGVFYYARLAD
jgi:hypothetical protein